MIDDEPYEVGLNNEEQFLKDKKDLNPKLKYLKEGDNNFRDLETGEVKTNLFSGNQQSSTEDATAEQNTTASNQGINQSKKNQKKKDTEFKSEDGSLEQPFEANSIDYYNSKLKETISDLDEKDHKSVLDNINNQLEQREKDGFVPTIGSFDSTMEDYKKQFEDIDLEIKTLAETPVEGDQSIIDQIEKIKNGKYTTQSQVDKANKQIDILKEQYENSAKTNVEEINKLINDLYDKRDGVFKNYELDVDNYNKSIQVEVDAYDLKTQELVSTYNTNYKEHKALSYEYFQALDDYERSLEKYQSGDEAYFLANYITTDDITLSSYAGKTPLKYKEDEDGRRLYFNPNVGGSKGRGGYEREVGYDYDRSLGVRFENDSYGKILDNIAYGTSQVWTALPTLKDEEVRQQTLEFMKNRVLNVPQNLRSAYYSTMAAAADTFTSGYTGERTAEARQKAENYMLSMYEKMDKLEFKETGKGMTGGGTGADIIAGGFGAIVGMAETMVPAMITSGWSLPFQIAAPMYTEYNEAKAKSLYGDDKRFYNEDGSFNKVAAMDELIKNNQTEIAIPLSLGVGATALEYIGYKGVRKYMLANPFKGKNIVMLGYTGNKEGLTEVGQLGFEKLNSSLGDGMSLKEASKISFNAMTGQEGLEMYLNGFIGSTTVSAGGRIINRALRSDDASLKDVSDRIENIANLNSRKNNTQNQDVKNAIDLDIKNAEQDLKNYINKNRSIAKVLTNDQKESLTNIINEKDNIGSKKEKLKTQLDKGIISKKEYNHAVNSLDNQDKRLSSQINDIKNQALEAAAEKTTETVKKQITDMGLKGEVTQMTSQEISNIEEEGLDSKSAAQSFGFIKQNPDGSFEIILNKDKPMEGTAAHEFMHAVLFKTLGGNSELQTNLGDALEQHVATMSGVDFTNINRRLSRYGEVQVDKDGNMTGFKKDANFGEETITIMSESILDGSLKFNEGFFTKIGDIIRRFSQNYLGQEIKFDTGKDVFNFIKDYSNSIKTGKVNKAIVKVAKEGAKGKLLDKAKTVAEKTTTQMSKDVSPSINEMGKMAWTNQTWKESGANFTIEEMKRGKMLDGLILAAQAKANPSVQIKNQSEEIKKKFVNDVYTQLTSHVKNFKPEDQGESGLFGWINPQLGNKALDVQKRPEYSGDKLTRAKDVDARTEEGAPVIQVEDTALNPEEMMIAAEEAAAAKEKLDNISKETLEKKLGLDEKADKEFEKALVTAFGTKLPEVDSKKLRTELRKIVADKLRPKIQKLFGREKSYDNFIQEDLPSLLGFIKVDDLIQIERLVGGKRFPNGRKILASKRRITSPIEVRKLQGTLDKQGVPLIDPRIKPESGPSLKRRLNPTPKELLAAFRGVNAEKILGYQPPGSMDSGMLGARKDRLAELLVGEIAFNKAIQVAEQQLPKIQGIEEIQNRKIRENYIAELGVTLDRDPTIQYSKETTIEQTDFLENLVSELGIENVIKDGKLLEGLPIMSKTAIQTVQKLYDKNITLSEPAKAFKQSIFKSNVIPTRIKNGYKAVGNLRYNTSELNRMHVGASAVALKLGPEIMNTIGYDFLGYTNRAMDSAIKKEKPFWKNLSKNERKKLTDKHGKDYRFQRNTDGSFVTGPYSGRLNKTKEKVNKNPVKLPPGLILEDVRVMNKILPLFQKIEKILALKSKKEKLKKLKALQPEIDAANIANIKLAKHIAKTFIELVRLGPKKGGIDAITALNILQSQTSIVKGFRGLSRLDLIDVREGSQSISETHPQYKQALKYYKNKGVKNPEVRALERVGSKGEHLAPNSNTMKAIAELMFKKNIDIDTELDLIFADHSQLLTSKFVADMIDDGPGGKTSTANFDRIKHLKQSDINNIVSAEGRSYQDVLGDAAIRSMQIKGIGEAKFQLSKAFDLRKAFNKQAELIKKQNKEIQADLEKRGYTFVESKKPKRGQTPGEMIKILQADLEKRGYQFSKDGKAKGLTPSQMINILESDLKERGYKFIDNKGMSTFDFDETLIIDGENFVVATNPKTGEQIKVNSAQWPTKGPELTAQGYEFNFDDFVNVRGGIDGPLLQKMKNQIKKYGPENVFVLTARPQDAATAIDGWLKSKGVNIPFKNITGLADSRGQAKADWMLEKFAEGYNDMYFVDDALSNVTAVREVLDQLDIKSKVVQAKIQFSKTAPLEFNDILEQSKGVPAGKRFSVAEARKRGASKSSFTFFVPPSAEDFKGLLYHFLGKGRQGDAHAKFFKENLLDPFAKASREWNTYKQNMSNEYKALKKKFKNVGKVLNKKVKGTSFTNDAAIRVYLWDKAGFEIPGLAKLTQEKLVKHVNGNPELKAFAEGLSVISRVPQGYIEPNSYWVVESIASDLANTVNKIGRPDFFSDWINNKNVIFSPENLNKIEAIYGTGFKNELEKILYRMETGQNRTTGKDAQVNKFLDWINGSVGAVMFFNMRSSSLQTISMVNFINASDNNIFKAAAAFANQPQFWKDFSYIFNSDMLKQRRAGLQIDVSASELTKAFNDGRSKPQAIIAYLLEKGFTPTQLADSFAIAMGGAPFYRNRVKKYIKDGMNQKQAEDQAFLDFQEVAEETQQSSRPDLISNQQAGPLGRLVLAWGNTPMQMTRIQKKKLSDLINRRRIPGYTQAQSDAANISGIIYYGVIQNLWFGALQTGLMFMLFGWNDDDEKQEKLELRVANGALDTLLRGTGIYGAAISTLKNVLLKWREERKKGWNRENLNIAQEAINLSPPMGTKMRKIMNAIKTEQYNKGVSKEIGFRIENPNLSIATNWVEALTNAPVARLLNKANNLEEAITGNHELWQRIALVSGWSKWSIGVEDEELEAAKFKAKEARKIKRDEEKAIKKEEEKKAKEEEKKKVEEKKKEEGIKKVRCSAIKSNGQRCNMMVETKAESAKCMYHKTYTEKEEKEGTDRDNDGKKEFRCTATKSNGERCRNRTENKNKKCYAHQ